MKSPVELANEVVKAAFWTDGGAEVVFGDGSVFVFRDHFDTFVSGKNGAPSNLVITALCLSSDKQKVINSLRLYNERVATHPKLIHGLSSREELVWRQSSPLDSLVLSADPALHSMDPRSGVFSLTCALKRTTLTLPPNSAFFSVEWPAVVLGSDNSSYVFVNPVDEFGHVKGTLASQRATRYVMQQQTFLVASPPEEWSTMLSLAMHLAGHSDHVVDEDVARLVASDSSDSTISLTLPKTREAVCHNGCMHFAELVGDDIPLLVAATHLQSASCMQRFHPLDGSNKHRSAIVATVTHLYNNVHGWIHANKDVLCTAIVASITEDGAAVAVEPNGAAFVVTHLQKSGKLATYHQPGDNTICMPRTIPEVESATRGRYLPEVVAACVSMSKTNSKRWLLRAEQPAHDGPTPLSIPPSPESTSVVQLSTRVENVGSFTALSNGITRVSFDDRTILSLTPDEHDTESGLVCTLIGSDATVQHTRVVQITPEHKAYPYLMYALPFRRFSKLPRNEQQTLQFTLPGGTSNSAPPSQISTPPPETDQSIGGSAPSSCASASYIQSMDTSVSASPHSAVEHLLDRTRRVLAATSASTAASNDLLKLRV